MAQSFQQPAEPRLMPGTLSLVRLFGVPVRLHFTFVLVLLFLVFVSAADSQSGWSTALYVLALFASVLLHELGHAVLARRYGIRTLEIVMFPIGGIARPERQPRAREEFWIVAAGPLVNALLAAGIFAWLWTARGISPAGEATAGALDLLAYRIAAANALLFLFNLLPAYPMDGGRLLRAALAIRRGEDQATRIAANVGRAVAVLLGLYSLATGYFFVTLIALFVYLAAAQEAQGARNRMAAIGFPVRAAMVTDFRTLSHGDTIRDASNLLLATSQQDFPVMHGESPIGLLTRRSLLRAVIQSGPESYVSSAMTRDYLSVPPDVDLSQILPEFWSAGSAALVMEGDRLLGLLTSDNVWEFTLLRRSGFKPRHGDIA